MVIQVVAQPCSRLAEDMSRTRSVRFYVRAAQYTRAAVVVQTCIHIATRRTRIASTNLYVLRPVRAAAPRPFYHEVSRMDA